MAFLAVKGGKKRRKDSVHVRLDDLHDALVSPMLALFGSHL